MSNAHIIGKKGGVRVSHEIAKFLREIDDAFNECALKVSSAMEECPWTTIENALNTLELAKQSARRGMPYYGTKQDLKTSVYIENGPSLVEYVRRAENDPDPISDPMLLE